jgi:hypothetical protein
MWSVIIVTQYFLFKYPSNLIPNDETSIYSIMPDVLKYIDILKSKR